MDAQTSPTPILWVPNSLPWKPVLPASSVSFQEILCTMYKPICVCIFLLSPPHLPPSLPFFLFQHKCYCYQIHVLHYVDFDLIHLRKAILHLYIENIIMFFGSYIVFHFILSCCYISFIDYIYRKDQKQSCINYQKINSHVHKLLYRYPSIGYIPFLLRQRVMFICNFESVGLPLHLSGEK